jgi:hypothetical protein
MGRKRENGLRDDDLLRRRRGAWGGQCFNEPGEEQERTGPKCTGSARCSRPPTGTGMRICRTARCSGAFRTERRSDTETRAAPVPPFAQSQSARSPAQAWAKVREPAPERSAQARAGHTWPSARGTGLGRAAARRSAAAADNLEADSQWASWPAVVCRPASWRTRRKPRKEARRRRISRTFACSVSLDGS